MIVQPDFLEHWKTRQLIYLTGDKASPLAVIRLWAHCQHSRRWEFPDMTTAQLASVCLWGARKPGCHVALVKAGFVEKLTPKGFAAHQWGEHNAQLVQKWRAGEKGGRPAQSENASNDGLSVKPSDNRPVSAGLQPVSRSDQTRPDEIEKTGFPIPGLAGNSASAGIEANTPGGTDRNALKSFGSGEGVEGLVAQLAAHKRVHLNGLPTEKDVRDYAAKFPFDAVRYVAWWHQEKVKSGWRLPDGKPIRDWKSTFRHFAEACERNSRGVSK